MVCNVFSDGSVDNKSKEGIGAFLILIDEELLLENNRQEIKFVRFNQTSSTKLELQTCVFILQKIKDEKCKINFFTDSQNIISLISRRERLESKNYLNSKKELIKNHELYKEFFQLCDSVEVEFIKLKGHKRKSEKHKLDFIFSEVDKAARKALRELEV